MVTMSFEEAACFEQRFWLQVMGDHARFIKDSLSPDETEEVMRARCFIQAFDGFLEQARQPLGTREWIALSQAAYVKAQEIRAFKLHLLSRHLIGRIKIGLAPTFLNHMVNETEKYLGVSVFLASGQVPPVEDAVQLHTMWLIDAVGHAGTISGKLDLVEKKLKHTSDGFSVAFEEFYLKAVELAGYMRTNLQHFPALGQFNQEVELEMSLFMGFLQELEKMELGNEVLGALTPLMADHMFREECYYMTKLSWVSEVAEPQCDPAKPRIE